MPSAGEVRTGETSDWALIPPGPRAAFWIVCLFIFGKGERVDGAGHLVPATTEPGTRGWRLILPRGNFKRKPLGAKTVVPLIRPRARVGAARCVEWRHDRFHPIAFCVPDDIARAWGGVAGARRRVVYTVRIERAWRRHQGFGRRFGGKPGAEFSAGGFDCFGRPDADRTVAGPPREGARHGRAGQGRARQ